ncbi:hypothetical protein UMZ34_14740 [Halopseudomonas pachastrellae]|nr:hypothetical protein UMZ34_14740 [Halopseudomonas pachastrellae]
MGRFPIERVMVPVVLATLAANWLQWFPDLDMAVRYPLLAWFAVDILFACIQWRWTRYEPVARARLKWLLAAWFAGAFGYLLLVIFPQVIGYPSVAHQTHAWAFFVLTYLGIALGIVRYRLFDLDRWILLAWFLVCLRRAVHRTGRLSDFAAGPGNQHGPAGLAGGGRLGVFADSPGLFALAGA